MKIKDLPWRNFVNIYGHKNKDDYRADIKLNGVLNIRFEYGIKYCGRYNKYYYNYIINGKKYNTHEDDYVPLYFDSLEEAKKACEDKYLEICNQIFDLLIDTDER